jgi:hypothetical protein
LSPIFGVCFSVDFSPLFGLRAFGKLLVLLCFSSFEVDLGPVFGPLLGRILPTAAHALRVPAMFLLITSPD